MIAAFLAIPAPMRRSLVSSLALVVAAASPLHSQLAGAGVWADSARREIAAAVAENSSQRLEGTVAMLDRALAEHPGDGLLLHYKGYAYYRLATLASSRGHERDAKSNLAAAGDALSRSAAKLRLPETLALRSVVMGQQIGGNPFTAMRNGRRASSLMSQALEAGPTNPRVWMLDGVFAMHTPSMFGGGLDRAESRLRRAIALFESDHPAEPAPDWGRAEAYVWLGQVLEKQRKPDEARATYARAIALSPNFEWPKRLAAALGQGAQ